MYSAIARGLTIRDTKTDGKPVSRMVERIRAMILSDHITFRKPVLETLLKPIGTVSPVATMMGSVPNG